MYYKSKTTAFIAGMLFLILVSQPALAGKCLFISSYHQGYAWSDGVEQGIRSNLEGKCELRQFDMDTKRNKDETSKKAAAQKAKSIIEDWQPDVVITADDNAARYLIQPFYKDHKIPFVFSGINWSVKEYGFPYSNTTGIVEVAPVAAIFDKVETIQGRPAKAFYIGADTLTETKNLSRFIKAAEKRNVRIESGLASTTAQWLEMYDQAQQYDFVIIGSKSGINDWDDKLVRHHLNASTKVLSVTNHDWMMPYTALGLTKIPEEQGEWAAMAALHILDGNSPSDIPIISNRKWDIWVNENILQSSKIKLPKTILRKAKKSQA